MGHNHHLFGEYSPTMKHTLDTLPLSNSFARLGPAFYAAVQPTPFQSPARLVHWNPAAADLLDLDPDARQQSLAWLSGNRLLPDSQPIAMLYAGHQFGHFVPQLGDGRAMILGETTNHRGERWEIQLKGSGQTPYSRDGDGRAVLRSSIREYLCSEAMHSLGIPTTRALALIGSDDEIYRERIEPGAIVSRLAPSHVRFGSFEVFFYRSQFDRIRELADYVITHHYPALNDQPDKYSLWLDEIIRRTADLIARWQGVGFCHGVMNSDNMSILGLTLDYGPFGFLDAFDPNHICNHTDHSGRYSYRNQPQIGLFNLSCLAQAILPLLADSGDAAAEIAKGLLSRYHDYFSEAYDAILRAKLGLQKHRPDDPLLAEDLLKLMANDHVDFAILFRQLSTFEAQSQAPHHDLRDLFVARDAFDHWAQRYRERLLDEGSVDDARRDRMNRVNPKYVLRNYLAEHAIRKAEDQQDYSEIDFLFQLLQKPFDEQPKHAHYADHPPDWAARLSVSCSS